MSDTTNGSVQKGSDEIFCSSCGAVIKKEAEICPKCGVRQKPVLKAGSNTQKSRITSGILALFLGALGIHWFYLKKVGKGLLYAGVFVLLAIISSVDSNLSFLPYIMSGVALFDAIRFFTLNEDKFQEKFVQ